MPALHGAAQRPRGEPARGPRERPLARLGLAALSAFDFDAFFASRPAILAPMEEVSDPIFRAICRARGASLCVTEFVLAEALTGGDAEARSRIALAPRDTPTAIQIYGADPRTLAEAAAIADGAEPAYVDVNCGCWVPKVARGGAGAGWLRDPVAMVAMAKDVVERVRRPVTVKTRIGWGDEAQMPIVELARRLEDVGVRALAIHCRTAKRGHDGVADWSWAARAQRAVRIPVIVNGDVRSAADAARAIGTGCAGVMIGRRAIEHPWIFREVRARLDGAPPAPAPTLAERFALAEEHLDATLDAHGPRRAVRAMRRYYPGYLGGVPGLRILLRELADARTLEETREVLGRAREDALADAA